MSFLFSGRALAKAYGAQILFTNINITIHDRDRIGLIGPNGSGKSTLLKIICGYEKEDHGTIRRRKNMVTGYLAQEDVFADRLSLLDNLLEPLAGLDLDDGEKRSRAQALLSQAEFPDRACLAGTLSGGWRKRLSLCRVLVTKPDLLVMDEPTNHLDIEGILWLEKLLASFASGVSAFIVVSHDRKFLETSVNRIVELSRIYPEGSFQVDGCYSTFLEKRNGFISSQYEQEERLANKVKRETKWLRRGAKARTSKARYRIDEAYRLQEELNQVKGRNRSDGSVAIDFSGTGRKTKKLLEVSGISKRYGEHLLFENLDLLLSPGTRIGLVGRNGSGKSTLITMLASAGNGDHRPDKGTIRTTDNVSIVTFSQDRSGIDPAISLKRALAPDGDSIIYQGRSLHVVSWARKFLFRPDQLESPVSQLSGGEQARIAIASIMRQPADILLLDEPTNDLDINSLNVLEESMRDFSGALVLVTHDRYLLDRVCDRIIGFTGDGKVTFYADYEQWVRDMAAPAPAEKQKMSPQKKSGCTRKKVAGRLSYLDQREYDGMEVQIMAAEQENERLEAIIADPAVSSEPERLQEVWAELEASRNLVDRLYRRWEELEKKKEEGF